MNSYKIISGPFIPPQSGKANSLVIFLHGYGSNGDDLLSIGEQWQIGLPDTAFVSPHGPDVCEAFAGGYQWFSIREIDEKVFEREKQMEKITPTLDRFIDEQLKKWGVSEDRLVVVGFSQGAMMAMYTMPRRKKPCAGVIGYSGMLIDAAGLMAPEIVKPPILAIHGAEDTVVPASCLDAVQKGFSDAKFNVETALRPGLEHGIDNFGLIRGLQFCREVFEKQ